ncbi:MAG: DUF2807 domain-containing protein [Dehalococcoidales bacterium]|nr:DUF2807 domain-containing protein [Dehalococcoidales bacterium]
MKKILLMITLTILLTVTAAMTGCGETVTDSGEMTTWEMANADFTRIEISHGFDVDIMRDTAFKVTIHIDRAVFEYLVVDQRGDTLRIGLESGHTYINTTQRAVITLPELHKLDLSGGSNADVGSFSTGKSLTLGLSGGSVVKLDTVTISDARLELSGGSRVTGGLTMQDGKLDLSGASVVELEGSAEDIRLTGSGASDFRLDDFTATTATINLSGGSTVSIHVIEQMNVDLSAGSELNYTGSPLLGSVNLSGGSTVNQE